MWRFMRVCTSVLLLLLLLASLAVGQVVAEEAERDIAFHTTYTSLLVSRGEEVKLDVDVVNRGTVAEDIDIELDAPPEWDIVLTDWSGKISIKSVHLEPEKSATLKLQLTPKSDAPEGDYNIALAASTSDKVIERAIDLAIGLTGEAISTEAGEVELTTDYPILKGPAGMSFEFRIDVKNASEEDRTFDLSAELPLLYDASFSPAFQKEKKISALRITAGTSESVAIDVSPGRDIEAGEYPIVFRASSGDISNTIDLKVIITGTYELLLTTPADRPQLNATATAGKATHVALILANNGSAPLEDITFSASKPDEWMITFDPDELASFDADAFREIDVAIEPGSKTIAGDYVVVLRARSSQGSDSVEFRVSVETPTTWGWIGIAIVVIVIAALLGIFASLRRR